MYPAPGVVFYPVHPAYFYPYPPNELNPGPTIVDSPPEEKVIVPELPGEIVELPYSKLLGCFYGRDNAF